jgi:ATP-dependent helicase HrpB
MSATLDVERVSTFLGGCPVVQVPGALHPLAVEFAPGESVRDAVLAVLPRTSGQVLCFLPGAREIERTQGDLVAAGAAAEIVPLHGSLDAAAQDGAIRATGRRRVILATNIAETSLTVPGVSVVVDSGLVKVARYDPSRGVDSLDVERVTQDSADQRAGRAARLGPGLVRRLWEAQDRLRPHREPDIARVDLAGPLLDLLAWGGDPATFDWFDPPSADRLEAGLRLLARLDAVRLRLSRFPLHPRLARILLDARGAPDAAAACARLSEGQSQQAARVASDLTRVAREALGGEVATHISDVALRHALFTGYADRLGRRRSRTSAQAILATGHGATVAPDAGDGGAEYFVALDIMAGQRDGVSEARVREASAVDREWIEPTSVAVEHRLDGARVRAARVARYDAIVLSETPVPADPAVRAALLRDAWLAREPDAGTAQLLRRLRFAKIDADLTALVGQAAAAAETLDDIDVGAHLPFAAARALAERAPASLVVPSGRTKPLEYGDDGSVSMSVKLQELFGLAESPRLGPDRVPVTFHLLAPNGRPVQTTRDLRSFWERTYPEVRKELRGRYPKHPWPEDPWAARPTHRTRQL